MLDHFVIEITNLLESFTELLIIIRNASNTDNNIKDMYDRLLLNWRNSVKSFLGQAFYGDDIHTGQLPDESLLDAIWAISSWDVFHLLTHYQNWSKLDYSTWLSESIKQQLIIYRRSYGSNE